MGQPHGVEHIAKLLHLGQVVRHGLLVVLQVTNEPNLKPDELHEPDGRIVGPAQVEHRVDWLAGVVGHPRYLAVDVGHGQFFGEHGTVNSLAADAFPDHVVSLGVSSLERVLLVSQGLREPWIVAPGDFLHHGIGRRADHKPLVGVIGLQFGVERDPDFRVVFTDGWDQHVPRCFGNRLGFLNPADVHALKRFDVGDVVLQPDKEEF